MNAPLTITEQNFETEVMASELPVLVEFGATWCGPCKTVEPELRALAAELAGKAKVGQIDIDRSPMLAQAMGVRSVPTFVVFHGGRPVDGRQGAIRKADMHAMLDRYLPRAQGALKPKEVAALAAQGRIILIDIREPAVFQRSRIEGAMNIPLATFDQHLGDLATLPAAAVLYCRTGADSKAIAEKLASHELLVAFLEGGVLAWETEGFKLERP
jgi:thioredoxin